MSLAFWTSSALSLTAIENSSAWSAACEEYSRYFSRHSLICLSISLRPSSILAFSKAASAASASAASSALALASSSAAAAAAFLASSRRLLISANLVSWSLTSLFLASNSCKSIPKAFET